MELMAHHTREGLKVVYVAVLPGRTSTVIKRGGTHRACDARTMATIIKPVWVPISHLPQALAQDLWASFDTREAVERYTAWRLLFTEVGLVTPVKQDE